MKSESEPIELPSDLIREMKRLDKSLAVLTPDVDRRVAAAAAEHFRRRPARARPATRRWAMAGGLAASLVIGVFLVRMQTNPGPEPLANDIDGSGVVDILDAFALARMNQGPKVAAQTEIDALITNIVALNRTAP